MRRASLLLLLAGLGTSCTGPATPPTPEAAQRPNVLLLTLDTLRWDLLGCYGNQLGATPNLDRLATEGVRFARAFTVTPLTIPAHSSVHTGLYPPRHGVRDNGDYFLDDSAVTLAERLQGAGYQTMASVAAEVTSHHWGFAQGFDTYYDELSKGGSTNRWTVERPGNEVIDDALGWLSDPARSDAPWFTWVHLFDAHHPYTPPAGFAERFPDRPYAGEVAFVDAQVGRLLEALGPRLDDTWVIVVADHGEGLGDHGESLHGMLLYNSTVKIPMLVRPPGGLAEGRVVLAPSSLVDVVPTVLAAAGLSVPDDLDGLDLTPAFAATQGTLPQDRAVYAESLYAYYHYGWAPQKLWARTERKLIESTTPELYAGSDFYDADDLAGTEPLELQALRAALLAQVEAWGEGQQAGRADMSAERIAQLAALGYLTTAPDDLPDAESGLPDPVQRMPVLVDFEKARRALGEGDVEAAEALARSALEADPGLMPPRLMLIDLTQRKGDLQGALALADEAVALRDSTQTRGQRAVLLAALGRFSEARAELEQVLERDPYLGTAWSSYLYLLYVQNDRRGLLAALEQARTRLPESPAVLTLDGALAIEQEERMKGIPLLEQALAADPRTGLAHYFLGVAAAQAGDLETAEKEWLMEVEGAEMSLPTHLKLMELYGRQGRWQDQLHELRLLRKLEPPNPDNRYATGLALFNLGRVDEAAAEVAECRARWPDHAYCALLQANVLKKQGDLAGAEAAFAEAKRLSGTQ